MQVIFCLHTDDILPDLLWALSQFLPLTRGAPPAGEQGELVLQALQILSRVWTKKQEHEGMQPNNALTTWTYLCFLTEHKPQSLLREVGWKFFEVLPSLLTSAVLLMYLSLCFFPTSSLCCSAGDAKPPTILPAWDQHTLNLWTAACPGYLL